MTVLGALATSVLGAVLCFLPGLDAPNYHAAFVTALVGSLIAGPVGIAAAHRALRSRGNPFTAALRSGLVTALPPIVLLLLNGMRVRQCDVFAGVAFMFVAPVFSIVWAALMGAALGACCPKKRHALPLFYLVFLAWAALDVAHIVRHPAVFAYNPFAGYFAGPLYDAVITIDTRLWLYRLNNVVQILVVVAFVRAAWDIEARRVTWAALRRAPGRRHVLLVIAGTCAFAFWSARGQIGYEVSRADVRAELGKHLEDERIVMYYDRSIPDGEAQDLLRAHRFRLDQIEARLDDQFPRRITSYVYANAQQKRRLMGAGQVYIAKPWLDEIHLNRVSFDNAVIRHELAHVVLGLYADPPLHIPTSMCVLPQMALIEGAAEAFEGDTGQLSPHEWSAAMRRAKRAPDLRTLLGPGGFLGQGSDTAYTLSGSFISWVIDRFGVDKLAHLYRDGDFAGATGQPLDQLVIQWEAFLDGLQMPDDAAGLATGRFNTPAIHRRPCGLDVARVEAEAMQLRQANDTAGARAAYAQVIAWIPEDAQKRRPLVELAASTGDLAATRDAYWAYLAVPGNRNPVDDATMTELMGDAIARKAFAQASPDPALLGDAYRLYASLRDTPQPEDRRRNSLVRIYLAADPTRAAVLLRYLLTSNKNLLATASSTLADEPLVDYLMGRRDYTEGRHAEALPRLRATVTALDTADATGDRAYVPWVRREAAHLVAKSLWALRDYRAAADAFRFVAGLTPYTGDRLRHLDWAERCEWTLARTAPAAAP